RRVSVPNVSVVGKPQSAGFGVRQQPACAFAVCLGHQYFHRAQAVDRQAVRLTQRLAPTHRGDSRRIQESADLIGLQLTARDESALKLLIHVRLRGLSPVTITTPATESAAASPRLFRSAGCSRRNAARRPPSARGSTARTPTRAWRRRRIPPA